MKEAVPITPTGSRLQYRLRSNMKFQDPGEMLTMFEDYFARCDAEGRPYTMMGLHLCTFTTKQMLWDYEKKYPEFKEVIRWARLMVIEQVESRLIEGNCQPTGLIIWLKNWAEYKDKSEVEHTVNAGLAAQLQEARKRIAEQKSKAIEHKIEDAHIVQ